MQGRTIAGILVLLVAAVIALVLLLRDDGGASDEAARRTASGGTVTPPPLAAGGPGRAGTPAPRVRSDGDVTAAAGAGAASGTTRTYVTETGNLVRDHRADVTEPKAVPAPLPPEQRTMSSVITAEMYRSLAPIVRGCSADLDASAKGPSPVVHVTLSVDVASEKVTASDATAVLTDIGGPAADRVIACVRDRAAGLTVDAKGEPDRSNYVVQFPIRVR